MTRSSYRPAQVEPRHIAAAADLVADTESWHPGARIPAVAAALADAEAGALLPDGVDVSAVVDVFVRVWREPNGARQLAEERARAAWARQLHREGLRPVGWPPVDVTGLSFPSGPLDTEWPEVPVDSPRCQLVRLSISGRAVPA